jgi:hypothetical protein
MIQEVVLYLIGFAIFVVLQAFAINGIFELFRGACVNDMNEGRKCSGNLFYMIAPSFFEKHKNSKWSNPFYSCVKCMASFWSLVTFMPMVIYLFGFHLVEIFIWAFDAFILVALNYFIYKKL